MRWKTWEALQAKDRRMLDLALFRRVDVFGLGKALKQMKRGVKPRGQSAPIPCLA